MQLERIVNLIAIIAHIAGLAFIAYQNVILARMLAELTALVARTH